MRFCYLLFFIVLVGCTQKQPSPSSDNSVIVETLIQTNPLKTPVSKQELNWSNIMALMESLQDIPYEQRAITLKNIKEEAIKLNTQLWPKDWDTKPIRARFNVFVTHVSIAADQRLGGAALEKQSLAINKMKTSWDIFANQISEDTMLSDFNSTIGQPIRKIE